MERSESDRIVPSVLLVDDRPENLLALEGVLKPLGARLVGGLQKAAGFPE